MRFFSFWNHFKVFHCSVIKVLTAVCRFMQQRSARLYYHDKYSVSTLFSSFYNFRANAEGGIWTLAPLLTTCTLSRGVPSASLGTSAYQLRWQRKKNSYEFFSTGVTTKRRGWDSNPRALADKRFSRPPRYDHFDTSPYLLSIDSDICALRISAELILPSISSDVNHKFAFFHHKVTIQSRCGWRVVNS